MHWHKSHSGRSAVGSVLYWTGGLGLSVLILIYIARHAVSNPTQVVVHILVSDVDVTVGPHRLEFREPRAEPVVLGMRPGRHVFRVRRRGIVVLEETFDLPPGESRILVA